MTFDLEAKSKVKKARARRRLGWGLAAELASPWPLSWPLGSPPPDPLEREERVPREGERGDNN